ncbi:MAG: DHHW family protein, partial [Chloroflexota bacterium]
MSAVLFMGLLFAGLLCLMLAPKATVASAENRRLATWPRIDRSSVVAGRYARGVESFIADHFPLRDRLLLVSDQVSRLRGIGIPEIQIYAGAAGMVPTGEAPGDTSPPPASKSVASVASAGALTSADTLSRAEGQGVPEGSAAPEAGAGQDQSYQWNNSLGIYRGRASQAFRLPAAASARYARVMTRWTEALGPAVSLFLMPVPVGSDFYLPARVKGPEDHERANIERLVAALPPAVVQVRAYDALSEHRDEPIFFRTDHHWTGRGAYYGYTAFSDAAGIAPLPMSAFTRRTCGRFLGSLYS